MWVWINGVEVWVTMPVGSSGASTGSSGQVVGYSGLNPFGLGGADASQSDGFVTPVNVGNWVGTDITGNIPHGVIGGSGTNDGTGTIDKGGGTPDIGPDGCSSSKGDKEALEEALKSAQKTLNDNLDRLEKLLGGCGDDRMSGLIGTLRSEADPSYTAIALSNMGCGNLTSPFGTPEAHTNMPQDYYGDYTGQNSIKVNIDFIREKAKEISEDTHNKQTDPDESALIFQDLLSKDLLHELIHNCTGKDGNPLLTELDVQVITNLLGNPRDPAGINNSTWTYIKSESDQGFGSNPNPQSSPWLNGSFFSWNPKTGEVQCGGGNSVGKISIH